MTRLGFYIFRQLASATILIAMGLTGVIWLTQSLRFIEMIVNKGLGVAEFLYLTLLLTPNILSIILPFALAFAIALVYAKLITDRELVAMEACGVSTIQIAKPAILLSLLAMLFGYALNLHLMPESYKSFRDLQWSFRYDYSHLLLRQGTFNTVSPNMTVYLRERSENGQIKGIFFHDSRDSNRHLTMTAEKGALVMANNGPRVIMFGGAQQVFDPRTNKLSVLYFDRYSLDIAPENKRQYGRYREVQERSLGDLFSIEDDPSVRPQEYGRFKVEGHRRLLSPINNLGFVLAGLACMLLGRTRRRLKIRRLGLLFLVVFLIMAIQLGLENIAARHQALIPLMYVAGITPALIAYAALWRGSKRLRRKAPTGAAYP